MWCGVVCVCVCVFMCIQCVCLCLFVYVEMRGKGMSGLVSSTHRSVVTSSSLLLPPHCVSVATNTDITGDLPIVSGLNELNIEGALTDELKLLQVYTQSYKCIYTTL